MLKPGFRGRLGHCQLQDSMSLPRQQRDVQADIGARPWPLSVLSIQAVQQ